MTEQVIVFESHGSVDTYKATLENAKAIFNFIAVDEQFIPEKTFEYAKNIIENGSEHTIYRSVDVLGSALKAIVTQPAGYSSAAIRRFFGKDAVVTNELKVKLFTWLTINDPDQTLRQFDRLDDANIYEHADSLFEIEELKHLNSTIIEWVQDYYLHNLDDVIVIQGDKWSSRFDTDEKKVRYIINMVSSLCSDCSGSDHSVELVKVQETF